MSNKPNFRKKHYDPSDATILIDYRKATQEAEAILRGLFQMMAQNRPVPKEIVMQTIAGWLQRHTKPERKATTDDNGSV